MKSCQMWIKVFVFGCWCLVFCDAYTESLETIVGLLCQSVVLPCTRTSNGSTSRWKRLSRKNGDPDTQLYNGGDVLNPSKYTVGTYDLTIHGLDFEDAGTYKCILYRNGNSQKLTTERIFNAELIVVDPICSANFTSSTILREGDLIGVNVSYIGKATPVTHCSNGHRSLHISSNTLNGTVVVITVFIKVEADLSNQTLNCTTYFQPTFDPIQDPNRTADFTNILKDPHVCSTPILNVVYEPRNLRLVPEAEYYDLGTKVRCVADANPTPTLIEWYNAGNGQVITGDLLIIDAPLFSPGTFKYRCTVKNNISVSNSTFTIKVKEKTGLTMTAYIIGLPVLIVILALVTTTAVLVAKNRAIRKELKNQEEARDVVGTELQLTGNDLISDYDEIIDDSLTAQNTTTDPPHTASHPTDIYNVVVDIYNEGSEVIPPKESNLCYTGLTESRDIPAPSVYTPLESSGQPPLPPLDYGTTTTSATNTSGIGSTKTPHYVNQPLYIEAIAEEA